MLDGETALAFSMFENKGVFALLLGSGVSRAAQIPTGWEITLDLIRRIGRLQNVTEQSDWAEWYRHAFAAEPSYSALLDKLAGSPSERRSILHKYIEPSAEDIDQGHRIPTKAHHAIARLVRNGFVRVIITTNFDRLVENALRAEGVEPVVIASEDDLKGATPLVHSSCYLIKVHGDYLDTRIKNTEIELQKYSSSIDGLLDRILDEHGLIICGWSAEWDGALRAAIVRAPNRRFSTYWIARNEPSQSAKDIVERRKGQVINISDADSFFHKLEERVALQTQTGAPNPRSLNLLVAAAKKYVAKPEYRIQLSDLLIAEFRLMQASLSDAKLGTSGNWSVTEFRRRVARLEAISEPLIHIFGTLGKWGDGTEFPAIAEILRGLADQPPAGGLVAWIELRSYPVLLLLYSYGLAALYAHRYAAVFQILSMSIRTSGSESHPLVEHFFLGGWAAGENERWQNLEGLEGRYTALSDHLHERFESWSGDMLISATEHTRLFELFELLGGLAFLSILSTEMEISQRAADKSHPFVWFPFGRIAWDGSTRSIIFAEIEDPTFRKQILSAGFAKGADTLLSTMIENVKRLFGQLHWH